MSGAPPRVFVTSVWRDARSGGELRSDIAVSADGERHEGREDADGPGEGLPEGVVDGAALGEGPHGGDGDTDGLDVSEGLEPAGQGGDGDQPAAGEGQDEDGNEAGDRCALGVFDGHADPGHLPGDREAEGEDESERGKAGQESVVEPEAVEGADAEYEGDHERASGGIRDGPPGEYCG